MQYSTLLKRLGPPEHAFHRLSAPYLTSADIDALQLSAIHFVERCIEIPEEVTDLQKTTSTTRKQHTVPKAQASTSRS